MIEINKNFDYGKLDCVHHTINTKPLNKDILYLSVSICVL